MNETFSLKFSLKISSFRKTQSALFIRDSVHHGFVRSYIDLDQINRLFDILAYKVLKKKKSFSLLILFLFISINMEFTSIHIMQTD